MSLQPLLRYLNLRTLSLVLVYIIVCVFGYFMAYSMRFDFSIPERHFVDMIATVWWVVLLQVMMLFAFGQCDSLLAYFRLPDVLRLFGALFTSSLIMISMWYIYHGDGVPPRAVVLADLLFVFLAIAGIRVGLRVFSSQELEDWFGEDEFENVLIVGAGEVGANLAVELNQKSRFRLRPVAFIDDDVKKIGRYVHGILVADSVESISKVAKRYSATKVIIAFPSASVSRMRLVTQLAQEAGLQVDTVPSLADIVSGKAQMTQLRPVQLEDLLGRDPVDLNNADIRSMLKGKRVLVTGAGGSIGSELVTQIIEFEPAKLICVDQAEIAIFNLQLEILSTAPGSLETETRVLDIHDDVSLRGLFKTHEPEVIFHAAAHKHVNLMEQQPSEALRNNFFATYSLAKLARDSGVERFILISTDKAINPTSVMGASKRLGELAIQAVQRENVGDCRFMAVRFGNVLGSSGSVIPIFRRQIAQGGPITVTDPEVTRYFMTVEEAVGLVLESATQGAGGEIFVLDMGQPIKIVEVARQMIALSGLVEGEDISIEFTGLRPGEKLYEEVQHKNEWLQPTRHERVLRFMSAVPGDFDPAIEIEQLKSLCETADSNAVKQAIQKLVPEYEPHLD